MDYIQTCQGALRVPHISDQSRRVVLKKRASNGHVRQAVRTFIEIGLHPISPTIPT